MDARKSTDRQDGGDYAVTTRIGAVALPLAIIVILVSDEKSSSILPCMAFVRLEFVAQLANDRRRLVHSATTGMALGGSVACDPRPQRRRRLVLVSFRSSPFAEPLYLLPLREATAFGGVITSAEGCTDRHLCASCR